MSDLTLARLNVLLGAEHSELDRALKEVANRVEQTGKKLQSMGRGLSKNVTAPLLAIGAAGFKVAGDFESSLAKMEGLVGIQRDQIDAWRGDIRSLATEYGSSASEAADALFFITSAGLRGADAMDVLEASLKASASGLGDTATIADLATSAMNAYGADVLSAAQATDVLAAAVRAGKIEPQALAGAMGQVLPVASNMGIRFDEVGAAMAAMSRTGTTAAASATQLRSIMTSLLKPTADAESALAGMGLSAEGLRSQIRDQGLLATLQTLATEFENNDAAQARVFGNTRALTGVMDLMGASAGTTADIFNDLADSSGVLDEAFGAQQTSMLKLRQMWASLKDLVLEIGNKILPAATAMIEKVTGVLQKMTAGLANVPGPVVAVGIALATVAAAAGPVLLVVGKLMTLAPLLVKGMGALGTVVAALKAPMVALTAVKIAATGAATALWAALAPALPVLAAIGAAVAASVYVWRRWGDQITTTIKAAVNVIRDRLEPVVTFVRAVANGIVDAFRAFRDRAIKPVVEFVTRMGELLIGWLGDILKKSAQGWAKLLRAINPALGLALDAVANFVDDTRKEMIRMRSGVEGEAEGATEALEKFKRTLDSFSQAELEITATGLGRNLIAAKQDLEALKEAREDAADGTIAEFQAASDAVARQEQNVRQLEASYVAAAAAVRGVGREVQGVTDGAGGGGGGSGFGDTADAVGDAIDELETALAEADGMGAALGDTFDVTAAKATAYESVVQALVAANVGLDESVGSNGETLRDYAGSFLRLRSGIQGAIEDERALSRLRSEGESVTTRMMTAEEQRAQSVERLNGLLAANVITEETHARALAETEEAYHRTTPAGQRYMELLRAQDGVLRDIQTPQEAYQERIALLDDMLNTVDETTGRALLTQEQYNAAVAAAGEAFDRATGAASGMIDPMREIGSAIQSSMDQGLDSLIRFTSASESRFASWAAQLATEITRVMVKLAAMKALAAVVPGGSALGMMLNLPKRASGGPVRKNQPVLTGERGVEMFVPTGAGSIVSNQNMGGGSAPVLDFSNFPAARNPLASQRDDEWQQWLRGSMREAIADGFDPRGS